MTNLTTLFPHERLIAYQVACELLDSVRELGISDSKLRDQAMRAAQSACLNIAEAAGRFGGPDKARVFAVARGEACEVGAAIDIASRSRAMRQARCLRCQRCRAAALCAHRAHPSLGANQARVGPSIKRKDSSISVKSRNTSS